MTDGFDGPLLAVDVSDAPPPDLTDPAPPPPPEPQAPPALGKGGKRVVRELATRLGEGIRRRRLPDVPLEVTDAWVPREEELRALEPVIEEVTNLMGVTGLINDQAGRISAALAMAGYVDRSLAGERAARATVDLVDREALTRWAAAATMEDTDARPADAGDPADDAAGQGLDPDQLARVSSQITRLPI